MKQASSALQLLVEEISRSTPQLSRIPESSGVMDDNDSVNDFNQVMRTNLTVNYAAGLDYIYRARSDSSKTASETAIETNRGLAALDLCAGPGHFTQCLAQFLNYRSLTGVDLSPAMIERAKANAANSQSLAKVSFECRDVLELEGNSTKYDLITCTNAAHHFDSIDMVRKLLEKADHLCRADGLVVLTDLCRLPTAATTESFTKFIGQDYLDSGLPSLAHDFHASMYAAWSADELREACPRKSDRLWFQVVSGGVPFFQALIGLPVGREELFVRPSSDWAAAGIHQTARARSDWGLTKTGFYSGLQRVVRRPRSSIFEGRNADQVDVADHPIVF